MKKLFLATALILCNSVPVMSATVIRESEVLIPVAYTVNGCDGIPVNVSGHFRQRFQVVSDGNGERYIFTFNAQGLKGTDILGRSYTGSNIAYDTLQFVGNAYVQTITNTVMLIGNGSAPNLKYIANFHITATNNGFGLAYVDNYQSVCR